MKVINNINWDLIRDIGDRARNIYLDEAGKEVIWEAKEDMPVETGNLKNSAYFESLEGHGEFHIDAPYAQAVNKKYNFTKKIYDANYAEIIADKIRGDFE